MAKSIPVPRDSNYLGMHTKATINKDGTWLEPEELTYPSGGFRRKAYAFLRKNEHNPIELPYGEKRVVLASIPDTYFSIPARLKYRGKTIRGSLSNVGNSNFSFTPEADPKLCRVCESGLGCKR